MTFLVWVASSVTTPARPTSEPVPAVVGTATIGQDAGRIGAGPPVADILEIPDRPGLAGHEGDELAGIEARAAAEGDDAVMAAGAQHGNAVGDVALDRIGLDVGDRSPARGPPLRGSPSVSVVMSRAGEAGIGDEQRSGDARGGAGSRQFGDAARRRSGWRSGSSSWQ